MGADRFPGVTGVVPANFPDFKCMKFMLLPELPDIFAPVRMHA